MRHAHSALSSTIAWVWTQRRQAEASGWEARNLAEWGTVTVCGEGGMGHSGKKVNSLEGHGEEGTGWEALSPGCKGLSCGVGVPDREVDRG